MESRLNDLQCESDRMTSQGWEERHSVMVLVMVMDTDGKICSVKAVTQSHFQGSETGTELDLMFLVCE